MNVELRDVLAGRIVAIGAALVVMVALVFGAIHFGLRFLTRAEKPAPTVAKLEIPGPRLQASPAADMAALRAQDAAALNAYGWVDRKAGVVRVPLDRAIELTLENGLPSR